MEDEWGGGGDADTTIDTNTQDESSISSSMPADPGVPADSGDSTAGLDWGWPGGDEILANFCYVSNDWAKPNTTIAAKNQEEADKKGSAMGLVFCHTGACTREGKFDPLEEGCG